MIAKLDKPGVAADKEILEPVTLIEPLVTLTVVGLITLNVGMVVLKTVTWSELEIIRLAVTLVALARLEVR